MGRTSDRQRSWAPEEKLMTDWVRVERRVRDKGSNSWQQDATLLCSLFVVSGCGTVALGTFVRPKYRVVGQKSVSLTSFLSKIHAHLPHLGRVLELEKLWAGIYLRGGREDEHKRSLDATDEPETTGDKSATTKPKSSTKTKKENVARVNQARQNIKMVLTW